MGKTDSRKWIMIAFAILMVIFVVLWMRQVFLINQNVIQESDMAGMGEEMDQGNVTYAIPSAECYDLPAYVQSHPDAAWLGAYRDYLLGWKQGQDVRIVVYMLRLTLTEGMEVGKLIPSMNQLENGTWSSVFDLQLLYDLNELNKFEYQQNMVVELQIPIVFYKEALRTEDWNRLTEYDTGIEVILANQPQKTGFRLNKVDYKAASDEAIIYMNSLIERAENIENAVQKSETITAENNVFEDGSGELDNIQYKVASIVRIEQSDLEQYPKEGFLMGNITDGRLDSVGYRLFRVDMEVKNTTNNEVLFELSNMSVCTLIENNVLSYSEVAYSDFLQYSETKSANQIILQPKESKELQLVFLSIWSSQMEEAFIQREENAWDNGTICLAVYRHGGMIAATTNDKTNIFIMPKN